MRGIETFQRYDNAKVEKKKKKEEEYDALYETIFLSNFRRYAKWKFWMGNPLPWYHANHNKSQSLEILRKKCQIGVPEISSRSPSCCLQDFSFLHWPWGKMSHHWASEQREEPVLQEYWLWLRSSVSQTLWTPPTPTGHSGVSHCRTPLLSSGELTRSQTGFSLSIQGNSASSLIPPKFWKLC